MSRRFRECADLFGMEGFYNPKCCRFPKSCSPFPYQEAIDAGNVPDEMLEPERPPIFTVHEWEQVVVPSPTVTMFDDKQQWQVKIDVPRKTVELFDPEAWDAVGRQFWDHLREIANET